MEFNENSDEQTYYEINFKPYEVVCRMGDRSDDLYFIKEGLLLICTVNGTQVKAINRIEGGEFVGELSFFDEKPRATHIVALEKSLIICIPRNELILRLPFWYMETAKNLTKKIRLLDTVVQESHYKKAAAEEQRPLSIEEQRKVLAAINAK